MALLSLSPASPSLEARIRAALGLLAAVAATGCASLRPLPLRPEPVAWEDTLPIPEPEARAPVEEAEFVEMAFIEEVQKVAEVRRWVGEGREALNLTHFDDVVDSSWFEHRNGPRRLEPEAVRAGPGGLAGPDVERPLVVTSGKPEGVMPGFFVEDARGDRYLFKFDPPGHLRLASSADVVASRLLWASGYNVPADYVAIFETDRLVVDADATIAEDGGERPMTRGDLDAILAGADRLEDGRYLALASRLVAGVPKGPFDYEGRRPDDPNDYYHHEYRRDLRGLFVVAAWLNHIDVRPGNTLDVWIDPPGYLRHYLIDFASALGSGGLGPHSPREGREHNFDLWPTMARMATLGFYRVGWEGAPGEPIHPSIGWMPVESYDPAAWKPNWPTPPWRLMTPADGYWGAKLVASIDDAQIGAAIAAARLPPVAADALARILAQRRDRTVEHWFRQVAPIEEPEVIATVDPSGFRLLFRDLGLERGLRRPEETRYRWELMDADRGVRLDGEAPARPAARQEVALAPGPGVGRRTTGGADPDVRLHEEGSELGSGLAVLRLRVVVDGRPVGRAAKVYLRASQGGWKAIGLLH